MTHSNLGRDKLWTPEIWSEINKAVKAEAGQVRVAQKVFPATLMTGAPAVPVDVIDPATMAIAEGKTKPFIEVSLEFTLTHGQVDNEATLRAGRTLARFAAKAVAQTEDLLVFQGGRAALPRRVRTVNLDPADNGLLALTPVANRLNVDRNDRSYPELIAQNVAAGIGRLTQAGQPGPYALMLGTGEYGHAHRVMPGTAIMPADQIKALVPGGLYASAALPDEGLLVSLGGEPTVLCVGMDVSAAFTHVDTGGKYCFRVFQRFQFVCRDPESLVRLQFINRPHWAP